MLYYNTVEPSTHALLEELQALPQLNSFYLVGGTALSLKFGHRISVDLDLFCSEKIEIHQIIELLSVHFKDDFHYEPTANFHFGIFCFIRNHILHRTLHPTYILQFLKETE